MIGTLCSKKFFLTFLPNFVQQLQVVFPQIALAIGVLTSNRRGGLATNFGGVHVGCHCWVPLLVRHCWVLATWVPLLQVLEESSPLLSAGRYALIRTSKQHAEATSNGNQRFAKYGGKPKQHHSSQPGFAKFGKVASSKKQTVALRFSSNKALSLTLVPVGSCLQCKSRQ